MDTVRICVDAMGGDEPAEVVLAGIELALQKSPDLEVVVVGNREVVEPFCNNHPRTQALISTEVIEMDEHPADAVRTKRDSSIVRGCAAVKEGMAQGFFSAGSTGAIFAAATLGVGRVKGCKRPALTTVFPGLDGHQTVVLDLGANADVRPDLLVQFAAMGRAFSQVVLNTAAPKVGLLCNGTEPTKGSEQALAYHAALQEASDSAGDGWFAGNCEGSDLLLGNMDVIVSDGFSMNIALKCAEGTAKFLAKRIKAASESSLRFKLGAGLLLPAIRSSAQELSGDNYGGALLLGLNAPVLIGHGATSQEAVCNGCLATERYIRAGLVGAIAQQLA